jgi:hypothetical protein
MTWSAARRRATAARPRRRSPRQIEKTEGELAKRDSVAAHAVAKRLTAARKAFPTR